MWEHIIITALIIIVYYPTLSYAYNIDDIDRHREFIKGFPDQGSLLRNISLRWYGAGSLGWNTARDHAITMLLHIITCNLIAIALNPITALLFSVHPGNHQTAIWLNGRRYSIVLILSMLALIIPTPLSILPWLLTASFQYTALFLPILFGHYYWLIIPAIPVIMHYYIDREIKIRKQLIPSLYPDIHRHIIIVIKLFGHNLIKSIGLGKHYFLYTFLQQWRFTPHGNADAYSDNHDLAIGLVSIATIVTATILLPQYRPHLVLIALSTLHHSAIIPIHQLNADRYFSLPAIFILYIISSAAPSVAICLLPIYIYRTKQLMPLYRNIQSLYNYHPQILHKLPLLKKLYPQIQ